jgi:hypothetical protein
MRKVARAPAGTPSNIRVVFVDLLKKEMMDLKALRKAVADAERRAAPQAPQPSVLRLMH